jgi:hypothetical protein
MRTTKCYACRFDEDRRAPSTAFLAGIAFAGSFNADAMREHLCADHLAALKRGWSDALPAFPEKERR